MKTEKENEKITEIAESAYGSAVLAIDGSGMSAEDKDIALMVAAKLAFFVISKVGCKPHFQKLAQAMLDAWDREMQEEKVLQ